MNRLRSPIEEIELISKLADLKQQHYQNLLILTALLELLIEKGIISAEELRSKTTELQPINR
jgi:hypothetical protein